MWGFLIFLVILFLLRKRIKKFFLKMIIYILIGAIAIVLIPNPLILLILALVFFVVLYIMSVETPKSNNTESGKEEK